ncbi:MAG: flagellar motor switch protein FliN [Anaerolineae bacterium]|nr:flagellar motor switch protein FliN [Phycisphaerae bacterium]
MADEPQSSSPGNSQANTQANSQAGASSPTPPVAQSGAQADPLAAELAALGSFDDAPGAPTTPSPAATTASSSRPAPVTEQDPLANLENLAPDMAELEALLKQASFDDADGPKPSGDNDLASQLMAEAQAAAGKGGALHKPLPATTQIDLPAFQQALSDSQASSIDLLRDVELNVKIELGRSQMLVEDVLKLAEGSVVELDKLAGDPVDVFVNDRLVARGEVLVLNDNFCVRVNEIIATVREEV